MIRIDKTKVCGWEPAIRGMRNPMNSWHKMDSHACCGEDCPMVICDNEPAYDCNNGEYGYCLGENDADLMRRLCKGGPVHAKFRRMIIVYCDIEAPLYWWKEFDTYKVGTVTNSCSTMHKIHAKEFTGEDFSYEHLDSWSIIQLESVIRLLNASRERFLETKDKDHWWQMIQLLPTSYNQKRTVMLNYEVLNNIYHSRLNHKLDEWHRVCEWIESLPYSCIITGKENDNGET